MSHLGDRLLRAAPWLLGASVVLRLAGSAALYRTLFVDLHVYVSGGASLGSPRPLHDVYFVDGWGQHLPFTYPPFAAMLFAPLHFLPFAVLAPCWIVASVAALYGIVRTTQRMIGGGDRRSALLWTTAAMWFEPVRSCLDLGQVGIILTAAVLYAGYTSRSWLAGLLVGVAAGVKLTPAITGLYFVGMRRWKSVAASAVVFLGTIVISALALPVDTRRYFMEDLHQVKRVGLGGYVCNQSLLGAISRIVGHDVSLSAVLISAVAVTAVLATLAWRALGHGPHGRDALGSLLVVQLFGLLASPISWTHHWIWVVPLVMWLFGGALHEHPGARVFAWVWTALIVVGIPTLLSAVPSAEFSRPWYLAWSEAIYAPMTVATLIWIIVATWLPRHRSTTAANAERGPQGALL